MLARCGPTQALLGGKTQVSNAEFDDMIGKCPKDIPADIVSDLFSVFDKSGNGTISINELKVSGRSGHTSPLPLISPLCNAPS
jgi:hypothetical protein